MKAWAEIASLVSDQLGQPISLLRIDSIVWQSGQIIGRYEPNREAALRELTEHFEDVGIEAEQNDAWTHYLEDFFIRSMNPSFKNTDRVLEVVIVDALSELWLVG
jgi:hypothetical protein